PTERFYEALAATRPGGRPTGAGAGMPESKCVARFAADHSDRGEADCRSESGLCPAAAGRLWTGVPDGAASARRLRLRDRGGESLQRPHRGGAARRAGAGAVAQAGEPRLVRSVVVLAAIVSPSCDGPLPDSRPAAGESRRLLRRIHRAQGVGRLSPSAAFNG